MRLKKCVKTYPEVEELICVAVKWQVWTHPRWEDVEQRQLW